MANNSKYIRGTVFHSELPYPKMIRKHIMDELSKIIKESPIKPTFTPDLIIERFQSIQKIKVRRGIMKKHLLFLCAFSDMMLDKENIKIICNAFELKYGMLVGLAIE